MRIFITINAHNMSWFNNKGYKLPTEPNDLIKKTLVDMRIKDGYIVFNEQQKVLDRNEYLQKWEWWVYNS